MTNKLLILFLFSAALCAQEGIAVFNGGKPVDNKNIHLSLITDLVESALLNTTNFKMTGKDRDQPCVTVSWEHKATITVYGQAGPKDAEITKVELRDYGPGNNDLGDIVIFCFDSLGARYNCEKYSPAFCDSVHSIIRYKVIK